MGRELHRYRGVAANSSDSKGNRPQAGAGARKEGCCPPPPRRLEQKEGSGGGAILYISSRTPSPNPEERDVYIQQGRVVIMLWDGI